LANFDLRSYARRGAELRVEELNSELEAIYDAFPDLRQGPSPAVPRRADHEEELAFPVAKEPPVAITPRRGRRWKMTDAQRKAVGERMKKYWAEKKAAAATKKR
jgi:hypothetical protein